MLNFNFPLSRLTNLRLGNVNNPSIKSGAGQPSGPIVAVIGLIFLGIGIFVYFDYQKTKDWPVTTATIQDVETRVNYSEDDNSGKTEYTYSLVYSISDQRYKTRETSSTYVSNGDNRQVRYNPDKPEDNRAHTTSTGWMGLLVAGIGGITLLTGVVLFFKKAVRGNKIQKTADPVAPAPYEGQSTPSDQPAVAATLLSPPGVDQQQASIPSVPPLATPPSTTLPSNDVPPKPPVA